VHCVVAAVAGMRLPVSRQFEASFFLAKLQFFPLRLKPALQILQIGSPILELHFLAPTMLC